MLGNLQHVRAEATARLLPSGFYLQLLDEVEDLAATRDHSYGNAIGGKRSADGGGKNSQ
jgi:hypothetical protein